MNYFWNPGHTQSMIQWLYDFDSVFLEIPVKIFIAGMLLTCPIYKLQLHFWSKKMQCKFGLMTFLAKTRTVILIQIQALGPLVGTMKRWAFFWSGLRTKIFQPHNKIWNWTPPTATQNIILLQCRDTKNPIGCEHNLCIWKSHEH